MSEPTLHHTDAEKIKRLTARHESEKREIAEQAATITAQAARIAELEKALGDYLKNFDDETIETPDLKGWLDEVWLPTARALLKGE